MRAAVKRLQDRKANGEQGFSILELVIWIVVAGILMGAAIVGYNSYKRSAEVNNLKSIVRDISTAAEAQFSETGVYPTYTTTGTDTVAGDTSTFDATIKAQIVEWNGKITVSETAGELSVIGTSTNVAGKTATFTGTTGKVVLS